MQEDPYATLQRLIGMAQIKEQLKEIIAQIKVTHDMVIQGTKIENPCIHMMFLGGPGTGKTTVARIVARILRQEGVLRRGHFFEIKGRDLCGTYVGETTPKTTAICRDAYGSVLFIDEAYSLAVSGSSKDYGREAMTALIAEMENHKTDMCVILAGYEEDMKQLYELNAGFESRVPFKIKFPNYSREELAQIFFTLIDGKFEYEEGLKKELEDYLSLIPDSKLEDKSFSNGRFIRNLYERVWGKAAYRKVIDKDNDITVRCEDFRAATNEPQFAEMTKEANSHHLGF